MSFTAYRKWNTKFGMRTAHIVNAKKKLSKIHLFRKESVLYALLILSIYMPFWKRFPKSKKWKIEIDKTHFCDKNMHYVCKMIALKQTLEKTKKNNNRIKALPTNTETESDGKKHMVGLDVKKSRPRPCLGNADRKDSISP